MGVSLLASKRSKDPNTQVGACVVDENNIIVSTGYNGFPRGCSDDMFPWAREGENTKYPYVVHAELNAILNSGGRNLRNSRLYVSLFPCNECAKAIIQSGIKEIIYISDKYLNTPGTIASKKMFDAAGVKIRRFDSNINKIELNFDCALTKDEVIEYCLNQGTAITYDSDKGETLLSEIERNPNKPRYIDKESIEYYMRDNKTIKKGIRSNMFITDLQEWITLNESFDCELSQDDFYEINSILWEYYERSPLDMEIDKNAKTIKGLFGLDDLTQEHEKIFSDILRKNNSPFVN